MRLSVEYVTQRPYRNLCWAACASMILNANGHPRDMLDIAYDVTGQHPPGCNIGQDPGTVLSKCNVSYKTPPMGARALTSASMKEQLIDGAKPIMVWWQYKYGAGSGHVGLVTGYDPAGDTWCLLDPWVGIDWVKYDYLLDYGGAAAYWYQTYFNIGNPLPNAY